MVFGGMAGCVQKKSVNEFTADVGAASEDSEKPSRLELRLGIIGVSQQECKGDVV